METEVLETEIKTYRVNGEIFRSSVEAKMSIFFRELGVVYDYDFSQETVRFYLKNVHVYTENTLGLYLNVGKGNGMTLANNHRARTLEQMFDVAHLTEVKGDAKLFKIMVVNERNGILVHNGSFHQCRNCKTISIGEGRESHHCACCIDKNHGERLAHALEPDIIEAVKVAQLESKYWIGTNTPDDEDN